MHYIRAAQLAKMLSVNESTLWRWRQSRKLPQPVKLGSNTVAWSSTVIDEWLATKNKESH